MPYMPVRFFLWRVYLCFSLDISLLECSSSSFPDELPVRAVGVCWEKSPMAIYTDHSICIVRLQVLTEAFRSTKHNVDPPCIHNNHTLQFTLSARWTIGRKQKILRRSKNWDPSCCTVVIETLWWMYDWLPKLGGITRTALRIQDYNLCCLQGLPWRINIWVHRQTISVDEPENPELILLVIVTLLACQGSEHDIHDTLDLQERIMPAVWGYETWRCHQVAFQLSWERGDGWAQTSPRCRAAISRSRASLCTLGPDTLEVVAISSICKRSDSWLLC